LIPAAGAARDEDAARPAGADADQLAPVLAADWDLVVVADEPAQDGRSTVGAVLVVAAKAPVVRFGDLGFDVGAAGRN
jgi:hypothetical protein